MRLFFIPVLVFFSVYGYSQKAQIRTIAFYNLENLFDTENDKYTYDKDFTPNGSYHWTEDNYHQKLKNIAQVINDIGRDKTRRAPDVIGVAEVENASVLNDLISHPKLKKYSYNFVHFDSPDFRGIDVALVYKSNVFTPTSFKSVKANIKNSKGKKIRTRDILVSCGSFEGEKVCFSVNHWPSRRGGAKKSATLRIQAAQTLKRIFDSLRNVYENIKIIGMGDLNDNPNDLSLKEALKTNPKKVDGNYIFNPMDDFYKKKIGTLVFRGRWFLFDQIFFTNTLLDSNKNRYHFLKAGIYNKSYLVTSTGKYKGYPFRSFSNKHYQNGYSDHFPTYIILAKNISKNE